MEYFKGDEKEIKMFTALSPGVDGIIIQKELFFEGAYSTGPLGDLIFENSRSPLANAIPQAVFRLAFKEIFDAFVQVGTFEAYLTVFRKVFGDDVIVDFTVPAPGKLTIDIEATGVELSPFISRYINNNAYNFDSIVDDVGDQIVFQSVAGLESEYELEQMLFEMVPGGIYTEITLTLA